MAGKMLIFLFIIFKCKSETKHTIVYTWKDLKRCPDPLYPAVGNFIHNGLLFVDGKEIKLTGIPNSPIMPVNWGISVLGKLLELLN